MGSGQSMSQAITPAAIKASNTAIMAVREEETPANTTSQHKQCQETGGPVLKQPIFNWKYADEYLELCNFEIGGKKLIPN